MYSTTTLLPNTTLTPCTTEWPALSPTKVTTSQDLNDLESDWELLPEPNEYSVETSLYLGEPVLTSMEKVGVKNSDATREDKPDCLKDAKSVPNLQDYNPISEKRDADMKKCLVEDGVGSFTSSSMVIVSEPLSIISSQSCWPGPSKISFRDAIMKEMNEEVNVQATTWKRSEGQVRQRKIVRKKPKFVVKPVRRCTKSTGDLKSLTRIAENEDHQSYGDICNKDLILGDSDAELYYYRKAQGKLGRKNGRKIRPDEAKRLQITMAKKDDQRQRQQASASTKR